MIVSPLPSPRLAGKLLISFKIQPRAASLSSKRPSLQAPRRIQTPPPCAHTYLRCQHCLLNRMCPLQASFSPERPALGQS